MNQDINASTAISNEEIKALRLKAERLDLAMSIVNEGMYDWDIKNNAMFFDERYYTMAGYKVNEFPASFDEWEKRVHHEDLENLQPIIDAYLSGKTTKYDQEFRFSRKDGGWMWIRARVKITDRDKHGTPLRAVGTHSDITSLKLAEARLLHTQKMDVLGRLAGGIAHDFNNMLGAIRGSASLLREHRCDRVAFDKLLDVITHAVDSSSSLNKSLLTFSRTDTTNKKNINFRETIENAVTLIQHSLEKNIAIKTDYRAEKTLINADSSMLENVIINLCLNARDAMPHGGELTIKTYNPCPAAADENEHTSVQLSQSHVVLSIADTGTGIDEATLDKIFDPFFTTKAPGKGTGLGLASAFSAIHDLGGYIEVVSAVGLGAEFKIFIPVVTDCFVLEKEGGSLTSQKQKRVLIVEDEPLVSEVHQTLLSNHGYDCIVVSSAEQCLETYQKTNDFDLILLDLRLPGMQGLECAEHISRSDKAAKIIILSGIQVSQSNEELKACCIKAVLAKPISNTALICEVTRWAYS
ncbi:MAG: hypothetical protein COA42_04685 [Alteromonadaceae bacterium]|nr:MAG: hypothetical protein COA42_04685 [Alteromonadaceae bacterium]